MHLGTYLGFLRRVILYEFWASCKKQFLVVAWFAERSLPTPEVLSLNPGIGENL